MNMKRIMLTIRDLAILGLFTILPLAVGMAVCKVVTGSFEFTFRYLTMALTLAGALLALVLFRKKSNVEIPKEGKAPPKLYIWFTLAGAMVPLVNAMFLLYGAADEEIPFDLTKQLNAMLLAPIAEELICRCLMTHIIKRGSESKIVGVLAAVITTAAWIIPHSYSSTSAILRLTISGLTASLIYQKTGCLRLCILNHAANNIMTTVILLTARPFSSPLPLAAAAAAAVIVFVCLIREIVKLFKNNKENGNVQIRVVPVTQ